MVSIVSMAYGFHGFYGFRGFIVSTVSAGAHSTLPTTERLARKIQAMPGGRKTQLQMRKLVKHLDACAFAALVFERGLPVPALGDVNPIGGRDTCAFLHLLPALPLGLAHQVTAGWLSLQNCLPTKAACTLSLPATLR